MGTPEFEQMKASLQIDSNNLRHEIETDSSRHANVCAGAALAKSRADEAELNVKKAFADACEEGRNSPFITKKTDLAVKTWAEASKTYRDAVQEKIQLQKEAAEWQGLREASQRRGFALHDLADMLLAGLIKTPNHGNTDRSSFSEHERAQHIADARRNKGSYVLDQ